MESKVRKVKLCSVSGYSLCLTKENGLKTAGMWNLNPVLKSRRIFLDIYSRLFNDRLVKASGVNVPSHMRRDLPPRHISQKQRRQTWPATGKMGM